MQRSRLKNIINKSKTISNKQEVGNLFDKFKKSLPIEVDDNYRLEAAWKAYGSPKNYKEALWQGMIQPIDENNVKLPSIGYNEETDEYEYLNKGRENETVNKDIRVWDNDVIPFVKELKQGGYIRTFDEEKDCWKYSKNKPQETQNESGEVIEQFQNGGKPSYKESPMQLVELIKNSKANFAKRLLDPNRKILDLGNGEIGTHKLSYATNDKGVVVYPEIQEINGELVDLSSDRNAAYKSAMQSGDYVIFPSEESAEWFTADNYKRYFPGLEKYAPQSRKFKQGGQMNVIPEGALHARKNNMELAKEGEITHKGVPVVDNDGVQQAEVEKEEWTMTKELTEDVEAWYRKYYDEETPQKEKDELAIKCGKRITKELLHNTDDRANLIAKMLEEEE